MTRKICIIIFLMFAIISCKQGNDDVKKVNARVLIESNKNSESIIKVFLEDIYGNTLTGAKIICVDKNNRASLLDFDALKYYYWTETELPASGDVRFYIKTNALDESLVVTIPHEKIISKPKVIAFQDSDAKSVLKGEDVSAKKEIQIAWYSMGDNCVYTIEIKTSLSTVYSCASTSSNITIPENTLKSNKNYYLVITAQKYSGDPLFEKVNYYSFSSTQTGGINFGTQ